MSCQLAFLLGWVGIDHIVFGVQIVGVEVQGDLVVRNGRFQIPQLQVAVAQVKGSGGLLSGSDPRRSRRTRAGCKLSINSRAFFFEPQNKLSQVYLLIHVSRYTILQSR